MFYWRIVDQHSFPLDVPEFPKLAVIGAYSSSEIYTPADVQDIISYMLNIFLLTELTIKNDL
jgi:hexosaminidase